MFSKEEKKALITQFWIGFAEAYPRKWLLHHTKIKEVSFKFFAEDQDIRVILEIGCKSEELRTIYFEKILSLINILKEEYLPDIQYHAHHILPNGKAIGMYWVSLNGCHFNRVSDWPKIYDFFYEKMSAFEIFYFNFEDYIKDLDINT